MVIEFFGGWAIALGKQKVGEALLKGIDQRLNPGELERYLGRAIAAANKEVPKLFAPYQADGLKGFQRLLSRFLKGRALAQLQKPLQEKGKPDEALLTKALVKDAEEHSELKALDSGLAEEWMRVFVATYFSETNNAIQFQLIKADYCEQILRVFDDVKFAGIAVEGQDIDRAERLAEIFVMPDLLEESHKNKTFVDEGAPGFRADVSRAGDLLNGRTRQEQLLWEQQQEVMRLKERKGGQKLPASELFSAGNTRHAVLLGAPGSGKTTLMNYFAVVSASAGKAIDTDDVDTARSIAALSECLPIIIRIRDLARHPDLSVLEFVRYFVEKDLAVT
ncbi:MAG: histidine kinase, partial [Cyanobacteria bacterium J06627_28]